VLNFQVDWFSACTWTFTFQLEIAYFGPKFDILGVNSSQMLKLNILTPNGTSLHDSAHFEQLSVKVRQGV